MEYTYPSYYKKFSCTADKCPDTCCAGWGIAIDKKSIQKYRQAEKELGAFGNRLHNSIDWKDESFYQHDKRCIFLNDQNLCDMVLEAGEDYLCKTCRRYPRHYEEFENLREVLLSLSCPEVAKILFELQEKVTYKTVEQERAQTEEYEFFDFLLFTKLQDLREVLRMLFQKRELPVSERMAFALAIVHDAQTCIGKQELFGLDDLMEKCEKENSWKYARKKWASWAGKETERRYLLQCMFQEFQQLEVLNEEFVSAVKEATNLLYHQMTEFDYTKLRQEFLDANKDLDLIQEQLLVYFLYSYLCGAVYDEDVLSKMKLTLVHTILITELFLDKWVQNKKMGIVTSLSLEEKVDIAHRYAREIEHSDPNLATVEKFMNEKSCFEFLCIMSVVLA